MKLDSTDSHSIARGNTNNGQTGSSAPEIEECPDANDWSYLFVHYSKVDTTATILEKRFRVFVHRTISYIKHNNKVVKQEKPTISGLIFVQGIPDCIKSYLHEELPHIHLVNDCSTGCTARIQEEEMQFFMRTMQIEPTRIRFLEKPYEYYGKFYPQVQITSGPFAGKEGYIIRIHRDRNLVVRLGNLTIAISGIHKELSLESAKSAGNNT